MLRVFISRPLRSAVVASPAPGSSEPNVFFPKPEFLPPPPPPKSGVVRKAAFVFFVANALPFLGGYWYLQNTLKTREENKKSFDENFVHCDAACAANSVQELCGVTPTVLLVSSSSAVVKQVRPQPPETQPLVLPEKFPISFYQYDPLVDVLAADRKEEAVPMDVVHLGLSKSEISRFDADDATSFTLTLVYLHADSTVTVRGRSEIVEDERLRDFYWRRAWGPQTAETALLRFVPVEISVQENAGHSSFRRLTRPGGFRSRWA